VRSDKDFGRLPALAHKRRAGLSVPIFFAAGRQKRISTSIPGAAKGLVAPCNLAKSPWGTRGWSLSFGMRPAHAQGIAAEIPQEAPQGADEELERKARFAAFCAANAPKINSGIRSVKELPTAAM
jgi:hypothetical protein